VIVALAGKPVSRPRELQSAIEQSPIGNRQQVTVLRDGKPVTLDVNFLEQPEKYGMPKGHSDAPTAGHGTKIDELGIEIVTLKKDLAEQLGVPGDRGLLVTAVQHGSLADLAGLSPRMVVTRVGQTPVKSVQEFQEALKGQSLAKGVLLLVQSREGSAFIVIKEKGS
jgi:serine protease Do